MLASIECHADDRQTLFHPFSLVGCQGWVNFLLLPPPLTTPCTVDNRWKGPGAAHNIEDPVLPRHRLKFPLHVPFVRVDSWEPLSRLTGNVLQANVVNVVRLVQLQ